MAKDLAIVLNNGSVNSAVVTAIAAQKHRPVTLFVEVEQGPASRARAAYDQQVGHFKPYREHTLAMPFLTGIGAAAETPPAAAADPRQHGIVAGQLLDLLPLVTAAARYAVHYKAAAIYLGLRVGGHAEELSQATEYVQILQELLQLPCGQQELDVVAPLLELEAWQVVDVGFQAAAPLDKTWSCLEDMSDPCWACRGCRSREAAFQQAAKPDPMRVVRKV